MAEWYATSEAIRYGKFDVEAMAHEALTRKLSEPGRGPRGGRYVPVDGSEIRYLGSSDEPRWTQGIRTWAAKRMYRYVRPKVAA